MQTLPDDILPLLFNGCTRLMTDCCSKTLAAKLTSVSNASKAQERTAVAVRKEVFDGMVSFMEDNEYVVSITTLKFQKQLFLIATCTKVQNNTIVGDTGILNAHISRPTPWIDGFGGLMVHMSLEHDLFISEYSWAKNIKIQPHTQDRGMLGVEFKT